MSDRNTRDEARRMLGIYLRDHHAAGLGGITIARRRCGAATGGSAEATLGQLVEELEFDRATLGAVLARFDLTPSRWKAAMVRLAVGGGRLKLNGRVFRRSALSDLLELEALIGGIDVRRRLWEALAATFGPDTVADGDWTYRGLSIRAESQRERLMPLHRDAARAAFGSLSSAGPPATSPDAGANDERVPGVPGDEGTSLVDVITAYSDAGFAGSFTVTDDARLSCNACHHVSAPSDVGLLSLRRLEGASDPDDMLAVIAIACPNCGTRGTSTLGFGPAAPAQDGDVLGALRKQPANAEIPAHSAPGETVGDHQHVGTRGDSSRDE